MLFQYAGGTFQDVFYYFQQWGIFDLLIPFILIFTILFAVLSKINLFGTAGKRFNAIIAVTISLLVVIPHVMGTYPPGADVIVIINNALPEVVLLIVAALMLLIVLGMIWGRWPEKTAVSGVAAIVAAIILIGIFMSNIITVPVLSYMDPQLQSLIVILVVFAIVFWYVTRETTTKSWPDTLRDWFTKLKEGGD